MWIYIGIAILIALGYGVALVVLWKNGEAPYTMPKIVKANKSPININELANAIAKILVPKVSREILDKIGHLRYDGVNQMPPEEKGPAIEIDERIIPMQIDATAESVNIENSVKEEEAEDKGLEGSKDKLASLWRRKKGT